MKVETQNEGVVQCPGCGCKYRVPQEFYGKSMTCKKCGTRFDLSSVKEPDTSVKPNQSQAKTEEKQEITSDDPFLVIGRLAVQYKFATKDQVKAALLAQKEEIKTGSNVRLGEVLVAKGVINQNQLRCLLAVQQLTDTRKLDYRFGEIAVQKGFTTAEQISKALEKQKQLFDQVKIIKPIGDILVAMQGLTREQRDSILAEQQRVLNAAPQKPPEPGPAPATANSAQGLDWKISDDSLSVFLSLKDQAPAPDLVVIKEFLTAKGIVHGLVADQEIVDYFSDSLKQTKPLLAAKGTAAEKGQDFQLILNFQHKGAKPEFIPSLISKEQSEIKSVKIDDLLAEKRQARPGKDGQDVFGRPLPAPVARDFPLQAGRGTRLSEDGLRIYAQIEGLPQLTAGGKIIVVPHLFIPGDVGVETGHIDFNGRVEVHGTIQSGYQVKCESLAAKEAFKCTIEASSDVDIANGINGALIRIRGGLRAKFIHRAVIEAFGDVTTEREIIDSKIEIGGACKITNGIIVSSSIIAMKGIQANQVGTKTGNASTLFVGLDTRFRNEIAKFKTAADKLRGDLAKVQSRLDELQAKDLEIIQKIGILAQQQDPAMVNKRKLQTKLEEVLAAGDQEAAAQLQEALAQIETDIRTRDKTLENLFNEQDQISRELPGLQKTAAEKEANIKGLEAEAKIVEEWLEKEKAVPEIKVTGTIYAETMLKGNKASLLLPETYDGILIKEIRGLGVDRRPDLRFRITRLEQDQASLGSSAR